MRGYSGIVDYYSCEKYPLTPDRIKSLLSPFFKGIESDFEKYLEFYSMLFDNLKPGENCFSLELFSVKINFTLYYGDVVSAVSLIRDKRDIWFLDGHDPEKNPDMWSDNVFSLIYSKSRKGTTLSSYTACGMVKKGLRKAGFFIKRGKGYGKKRHMIMGEYLSPQ
jgi:tRNA 5-methylaminomethyl-2-thiouridine biosynthesis bifunctional protein